MSAGAAVDAVAAAYQRIAADGRPGIFLQLVDPAVAAAAAAEVDRRVAAGEHLPLAGRTLAVKGNIDVAGLRTTAGCPSYGVVASRSAAVVEALEAAGAVVVGVTNLDQFATGLVGTRSPYGVCPNSRWPGLISGGSSSGSAVAVASGLVDLALGTDTAGSGRVPAAANGIVGLKPTRGRSPVTGVVPACRSLDCVSFFAHTAAEAARCADIAGAVADDGRDPWRRVAPAVDPGDVGTVVRVGVPKAETLFFDGDDTGIERFRTAVTTLVEAIVATPGAPQVELVDVDLEPFLETASLLYGGAFVAERFAAVGPFVAAGGDDLDPVVRRIITESEHVAGWEVFRDLEELQRLAAVTRPTWEQADVLVVPSVPRVPTVDEVAADPLGVNAMLGTYTNFVNLLDLTALTVPVGAPTPMAPPPSVTLIAPAWQEARLVALGGAVA